MAAIAVALAGCGGSGPTATTTGSQPDNGIAAAYQFSRCMREHGVTNFPDPIVHSSPGKTAVGLRVSPAQTGLPGFKAAQQACQSILPAPNSTEIAQQQRGEEQGKLGFARCLRGRGYPDFPDPTAQGRLNPSMVAAAGVDIHTPAFLKAALACVGASNGTVSRAALEQALGGG